MGKQAYTMTTAELSSSRRGCGGWQTSQLAISAVTLGVMCAIVMFLMLVYSLQPSTVELTGLSVPSFKAELRYPVMEWNSTWHIQVKIKNQETRWRADYEKVRCTLYSEEAGRGMRRIGSEGVAPFTLGRGEERTERVRMHVHVSKPMGGWEFETFSVRVEAYAHFRVEGSGMEEMLVRKCRHVDATCSAMKMVFRNDQGRLHEMLSEPKLCEAELHLDKVITIDGDTQDDVLNNR